jgi:hypothetical protein
MANIEHSTLGHSLVHEPKHITIATTADAGKVITSSSSTNGVSTYRKLGIYELDAALSGANPFTGFQIWADSQYVTGARRSISATTRTALTVNGLGSGNTGSTYTASGSGNWWNTSTNKITPTTLNDFYLCEVSFTLKIPAGSSPYATVDFDVGGTTGILKEITHSVHKGAAVDEKMAFSMPVHAVADFKNNGATIYLTTSHAAELFDVRVMITRLHKAA